MVRKRRYLITARSFYCTLHVSSESRETFTNIFRLFRKSRDRKHVYVHATPITSLSIICIYRVEQRGKNYMLPLCAKGVTSSVVRITVLSDVN